MDGLITLRYFRLAGTQVAYSATGELLQQFLKLGLPQLFIYGDKNQHLSYLPQLTGERLQCRMITNSDHFVFYDNPYELYATIASFADSL